MSKNHIKSAALAAAVFLHFGAAYAADGAHVEPIKDYVTSDIMPWLGDAVVVDAINAQNAQNASLSQGEIDKLDKQWRAETDAADKPLIEAVMSNGLSAFLDKKKNAAGGMITEMFVMDSKGLNVGQSDATSDYWQGDEAKWKNTFLAGPSAIFVDEIENDESTQTLQSQVSISITDPASGKVIGAITIGINVDAL